MEEDNKKQTEFISALNVELETLKNNEEKNLMLPEDSFGKLNLSVFNSQHGEGSLILQDISRINFGIPACFAFDISKVKAMEIPGKEPQVREIVREVPVEVLKEVIVEVQVPVEVVKEVVKYVDRDVIREVPVEVIKQVEVPKEIEVIREVEVIKEIPVEIVIEKPVEVVREIVKEVPVEVITEVLIEKDLPTIERVSKKIATDPIEPEKVEVIIERYVEKLVEVPVEKEIIIEVPVEKIVDRIVEIPVEKIIEVPIEVIKEVIKELPKPKPKTLISSSCQTEQINPPVHLQQTKIRELIVSAKPCLSPVDVSSKVFNLKYDGLSPKLDSKLDSNESSPMVDKLQKRIKIYEDKNIELMMENERLKSQFSGVYSKLNEKQFETSGHHQKLIDSVILSHPAKERKHRPQEQAA